MTFPLSNRSSRTMYDSAKRLLHVAEIPVVFDAHVVWPVVVDNGGALFERLLRVEDAGQLLVVDFDKLARLLGDILICGCDRRHSLMEIAHFLHGKGRLVPGGCHEAPRPAPEILRGYDALDARQPFRAARIDTENPPMGNRRPGHLAPEHVREAKVGCILRLAHHLLPGVDPG